MDGGGRLLRSLGDLGGKLAPSLSLAGPADPFAFPTRPQAAPRLPRQRRRADLRLGLQSLFGSRLLGTILVIGLLSGAALYGAVRGGQYDAFVAEQGRIPDILAKAIGFSIKGVTINGTHELSDAEVLRLAGVSQRNSLVFLDVAAVRDRLRAVPLIKDASVSKLFPNRLAIEIEERQPYALWQKDGVVSIVAADGTPIDDIRDAKFERLPLVVGFGANQKITDYVAILDAAGDLRDRIRAGIYVSGRRWTLKTKGGITIDLPETDPAGAIAQLDRLEHDGHILEKDVLALDLRVPGRVTARLTEDAAATRADALAKKTKKKGATT